MERTRKVRDGFWRSFYAGRADRGHCAKNLGRKDDPVWMREFRMKSLQIYRQMQIPDWGPPIDGLDMDHIETYVRPKTKMRGKWSEARSMIVSGFADDVSKELPDFLETFYLQNNP